MSTPVEQIKERLNIEDVVGSYVKLEKAGKNLKAKCPFHNEKTPSFYVSPDRGSFYCFGCGAKGDIFSFVEQFEGLDFMGALKLLGDRAGVDISQGRGSSAAYAEAKTEKERLFAIMEEATKFFETTLWANGTNATKTAAAEARDYIVRRGITEKTTKEFRIGFAPDEWRSLYDHVRQKGYRDADIEKAGLAKRPDTGDAKPGGTSVLQKSLYDRFRDRIMFPIFDSSGRVIAFSGRILHDTAAVVAAKYLNSPDTPLYNKSTVLYGIDKAKQTIRERGYTILVEGQMDLVLSHQVGIKNTVAVSGTALADTVTSRDQTVNNLGVVRRLSPNLILAFDSDAAGRKAAMRSAEIALSLGMDVKIADLPEGRDPADMVLADPESWKNILRAAKPIIEFQLSHVVAEAAEKGLDNRKIPALIRERVLPFIIALNGAMEKAHFIAMVHDRTGIAEDAIRTDLKMLENKLRAENRASQSGQQPGPTGQPSMKNGTVPSTAEQSRLDIISRKLFGLLAYLAREKIMDVEGYYSSIRSIAGDVRYHNLIQHVEPSKDEHALEAEVFFGTADDLRKNESALKRTLEELMLNFEEDIVKSDLAFAMSQLSKRGDDADFQAEINACIKKIAEIDKKRARR
jgi:DNA primase